MSDAATQDEWVKRVLGVTVPRGQPAATAAAAKKPPLMPIWRDAKEEVDVGIGRLQDALRALDDDDLNTIVEYGLYGATEGQSVRLIAALTDNDSNRSPQSLRKVAKAVGEFRDFLASAPIVTLIEDNPFGVKVGLRDTLGAALAELAKQCAA